MTPEASFPVQMVSGVPVVAAPEEIDIVNAGLLREPLNNSLASRRNPLILQADPDATFWDANLVIQTRESKACFVEFCIRKYLHVRER